MERGTANQLPVLRSVEEIPGEGMADVGHVTSGLLAAAKHPHAQEVLKKQLHTEGFRRVYLAVCEGSVP